MQRIVYFDFLRGIAIIMVVCLHCIDYSAMEGPVLNLFGVEFRNLLNAAVPLFLAISGYFMANKKTDTPTAYKEFLYNRQNQMRRSSEPDATFGGLK